MPLNLKYEGILLNFKNRIETKPLILRYVFGKQFSDI